MLRLVPGREEAPRLNPLSLSLCLQQKVATRPRGWGLVQGSPGDPRPVARHPSQGGPGEPHLFPRHLLRTQIPWLALAQ